jgi:hypothetical protein
VKFTSKHARLTWLRDACVLVRERALDEAEHPPASRLSQASFVDAVRTALPTLEDMTRALDALEGAGPVGEVALILPNNVETAIVRPLFWAILAGNKTRVKMPSVGAGFAELVVAALVDANPVLGSAITVWRFAREDARSLEAFVHGANAVHVFGRDETVRALATHVAPERLVSHGTGLGIAAVTPSVDAGLAARIACDVARHDQRGCLSPQLVLVENGDDQAALAWAEALHAALTQLDSAMPRGAMSRAEAQAERVWRDVAQATGELFATTTHAVSAEGAQAPRDCPGLRNIAVHGLPRERMDALLLALGPHLKCIGAVDAEAVVDLRARFPNASDVVLVGAMQTPRFDAPMDGAPAHTGFALF